MDPLSLKLTLAYFLDLGLGDPRWLPHPVRGVGWLIQRGEALLRGWVADELLAGWILVTALVLGTAGLVEGMILLASQVAPWFPPVVEVLLLYVCLSTRDLAVESWPVYRALREGDYPEARKKVAMIVGRDTESLSEPEIVRATVETIGESLMDGIIAPLFYAALGGVWLACVYKTVNTLDSMVGYRSARYIRFGRAAARVDSWMNAVPARITALFIALAGAVIGFSGRGSLRALFRDAWGRGENSFIPEAAMAGALGVRLGGVNIYGGKAVEVPYLGDPERPLQAEVIPQAIRLMVACSLVGFVAALAVIWGIRTGRALW